MTEDDWLTSLHPERMLDYLRGRETTGGVWESLFRPFRGAVEDRGWSISRRKLRLFAVACCRRVLTLLRDPRSRNAVEASAYYADGLLSEESLHTAQAEARSAEAQARLVLWDYSEFVAGNNLSTRKSVFLAARAAVNVASPEIDNTIAAVQDVSQAGLEAALESGNPRTWTDIIGSAVQANLLRDIVGNPFDNLQIAPAVLAWNDAIIPRIAEGIYADRAFERMPILHDALLDAGCNDEVLLSHCRNREGHVLGCWALDAILGRE